MKKCKANAFTLVELLAVIVILAIILVIAVPQINKVISSSTKDTFIIDAKIVLEQIDYKLIDKSFDITILDETNVEDNLGIKNNNYEKLTARIIDDEVYIFVKGKNKWKDYIVYGKYDGLKIINNSNPIYYLSSNLVLQYDGIYNGGMNIHNDNTSSNKEIWKDLSSTGNDGILYNVGYDQTSGWTDNALVFDGTNDRVESNQSLNNYDVYTYEVLFKPYTYRYTSIGSNALEFKWRQSSELPYWNFFDSSNNPNSTRYTYIPDINNTYLFSATYDGSKLVIYIDGKSNNIVNKTITPKLNFKLLIGGSNELVSGEVYAIRVYDKALSDEEIFYNYLVDKFRYDF